MQVVHGGMAEHLDQHMLCIVAIIDCTLAEPAKISFEDLVTLLRRTL